MRSPLVNVLTPLDSRERRRPAMARKRMKGRAWRSPSVDRGRSFFRVATYRRRPCSTASRREKRHQRFDIVDLLQRVDLADQLFGLVVTEDGRHQVTHFRADSLGAQRIFLGTR